MNAPANSHRSPVNCSKPGCSSASNGIEPFDYCAPHYRSYMEWLASRSRLEAYVEVCVKQIDQGAPELEADDFLTTADAGVDVALLKHERTQALVGAVMDQIGHHATRSVYRVRPNDNNKEYDV